MDTEGSPFLQTLIAHEAIVGTLYETFSEIFPARQAFWGELAREEAGHADALAALSTDQAVNDWLLGESGLRLPAIRSSIGYVQSQIERARRGELGSIQALSIARDLEAALIEEQFARMSSSAHVMATPILLRLAAETKRHREMLAEALEAERRQGA